MTRKQRYTAIGYNYRVIFKKIIFLIITEPELTLVERHDAVIITSEVFNFDERKKKINKPPSPRYQVAAYLNIV